MVQKKLTRYCDIQPSNAFAFLQKGLEESA
jgi:hypothetical protein